MENVLDRLQEIFSVIDVNIEFSFNRVMNQNTSFDIHIVVLVIPVSLECNGHSVPSIRVDMSKSVTYYVDYAPSENMRLLVQVNVVLVWIVKETEGLSVQSRQFLDITEPFKHLIKYNSLDQFGH